MRRPTFKEDDEQLVIYMTGAQKKNKNTKTNKQNNKQNKNSQTYKIEK